MVLLKTAADLHNYLEGQRKKGSSIGFVPTMGALHPGHASLIYASVEGSDHTVSSIFVNPTQFNDPNDFKKYPATLDKDIQLLEEAGCDLVFVPAVEEVYPGGTAVGKKYQPGYLETVLEGKFRPGHFQGVCMVMDRLLNMVQPDHLFLGQKDYQQCMVIKELIRQIGMNEKIAVHIQPTLREKNGLAMSSRNRRLTDKERESVAPALFGMLQQTRENLGTKSIGELKTIATKSLEGRFKVDYFEIADANDLTLINEWDGKKKLVALVAAFLGEVRLIDNLLLN